MKNIIKFAVACFATTALLLVGCGGGDFSTAPVSGKVTSGGKPVPNIRVDFTPMPNSDNTDPGPWSTGVTNEQGEYTLKTRYKKNGASVGMHTVDFVFEDAEDMEGLQDDMEEARGEDGSAAEVAAVKKRIADFQAMRKNRPNVPEDYSLEVEVPKGGTKEADFDLPAK